VIRVAIVDDHKVVREGLSFLLRQQPDIEIVAECVDGREAIRTVRAELPAVVLMDLLMPGVDGLTALRTIKRESPATAVVILTSHLGEEHIFDAIKAGATSYLLKTAGVDEVVEAVRAAARGETHLDPTVAARVLQELRAPRSKPVEGALTRRETEVLTLIARGHSNREIARRLYVGEETIKTHVSNILAKLHLSDRTQAAIYALREGIVAPLDEA
jgi:NarL family two-component system response regulator LiaR